ncbi:MAG: hypothetical protein HRU22_18025 [Gammaproteobacteria bacterium]|nr:hypothetical protein [Gammaproteobacteria bacterium]
MQGKETMVCFYGFKLHLLINHVGEIIPPQITPDNTNFEPQYTSKK